MYMCNRWLLAFYYSFPSISLPLSCALSRQGIVGTPDLSLGDLVEISPGPLHGAPGPAGGHSRSK